MIEFIPISEQNMVLAVHKDHPLAKYDTIDLKDISNYDFIGYTEDTGLYHVIEKMFKEIGKKLIINYKLK